MLNAFCKWAKAAIATLADIGVEAELTVGNASSNQSARLDVQTPSAVARITFWESGDGHLEAIDLESERLLYSRHVKLKHASLFDSEFKEFFSRLNVPSERPSGSSSPK